MSPAYAADNASFEVLKYQLPASKIAAKMALTLESCAEDPVVSGEASLTADAGAAPPTFALTAGQLESARVKRTLNVTLHDTGTIATINSQSEDRTGSIIGNVIKFVAGVAGSVLGLNPGAAPLVPTQNRSKCTVPVQAALQRVAQIDDILTTWRNEPVSLDAKAAIQRSQAIDKLAAERAALRVGILHVDLESPLDLNSVGTAATGAQGWAANSKVDTKALHTAWLADGVPAVTMNVIWAIALPHGSQPLPAVAQPAAQCQSALAASSAPAMCFVKPANASLKAAIAAQGVQMKGTAFELEAAKALPIPQWGSLQLLPLKVGLGGNRDLSLTLDKFGRPSEMKWTSQARAETVTAGLAGIASQVSGIVSANSDVARQKAEIEAMTTQQTLNRLRACREILAAGGSACPADAPVSQSE